MLLSPFVCRQMVDDHCSHPVVCVRADVYVCVSVYMSCCVESSMKSMNDPSPKCVWESPARDVSSTTLTCSRALWSLVPYLIIDHPPDLQPLTHVPTQPLSPSHLLAFLFLACASLTPHILILIHHISSHSYRNAIRPFGFLHLLLLWSSH